MRWVAIVLVFLASASRLAAATAPPGYVVEIHAQGFAAPTAMAFAPDGRLFICEQAGRLRVVDDGVLLATPFLTLDVDADGERGLLGVAFDPGFATNHYVYVYYTTRTPVTHNRVSRFRANGNTALAGSEVAILEFGALSSATSHNGGAIHFGNDDRLYVAVGDNTNGANAQLLTNRLGKILRINANGSIPADNPFFSTATGVNRAIWAYGLRNPFTLAVQRSTGRIFINDVGEETWEEIDEGMAGANYGWPTVEGPSTNPAFTNPLYVYGHSTGGCAITGGAFYETAQGGFPSEDIGDYFFGDYCLQTINKYDTTTGDVSVFSTEIRRPVDVDAGPDGALYYLSRPDNTAPKVYRVRFTGQSAPRITQQPVSATVTVGQSVTFTVVAAGTAPLHYQWRRNGADINGANSASYRFTSAQLSDSGAAFDVVVSNTLGMATSNVALLTVTTNTRPIASFTQPVSGTTYAGGDRIQFAATASDAEDGSLPASAFTWWVNLHHDSHVHPQVLPITGSRTGSFTIPVSGETSPNVFYRIHLRVRDSGGLTRSVSRDVRPRKSTVTLATNPGGLQLRLDGQPVSTPHSFVGVEGIHRKIEAVSPQGAAGNWVFASWSDGGARIHTISTPTANTTYTATFVAH